jgi:hypothetical protein
MQQSLHLQFCKLAVHGTCPRGSSCWYAHTEATLQWRVRPVAYKTVWCRNFSTRGICRYHARCLLKHDETTIEVFPTFF